MLPTTHIQQRRTWSTAPGGAGAAFVPEDSPMDVAQEIGESVAANWYGSVSQGELNELLADRPILPVEIDRVLLKDCAQRIGEYKTDLQGVRKALRPGVLGKAGRTNLNEVLI